MDRIYVPLDGLQNLCKIDYIPCPFSDHSQCPIIQIKKLGTSNNHTTYWKLNDSILSKQTNLLCVKTYILDLIEKKNPTRDPISWWDFFQRKITKYLKFLSFRGRTKFQNKERILNQKLDLIDKTNTQKYFQVQQEILKIQKHRLNDVAIRARNVLISDDEEPSTELINQEQTIQERQSINNIIKDNSVVTFDHQEIIQTFYKFYSQLWSNIDPYDGSKNSSYLADLHQIYEHFLTSFNNSLIIHETEVSTAVKMINKHASPGSDGLTASFYTSFPSLVKLLTNVYNNMIFQHQMSPSQGEDLVKLIPKKNTP